MKKEETGLEQMLADEWAVDRRDIYMDGGIYANTLVDAAQPIRPDRVLARLKLSEEGLVQLLMSGKLGRPGKLGRRACRVAVR